MGEKIKWVGRNEEISIEEVGEGGGVRVEEVSGIEEKMEIGWVGGVIKIGGGLGVGVGSLVEEERSEGGGVMWGKGEGEDRMGF